MTAQEEARSLRHDHIGTEHILLGLPRVEDGLAANALAGLGLHIADVRKRLTQIVGPGEEGPAGQISFAPRAKQVLALALREARSLRSYSYIGTEHILLGLVREHEGVAARIVLDFDADPERIRSAVLRMLRAAAPEEGGSGGGDPEGAWQPGLRWEKAAVRWTPAGPDLHVPYRLEHRALALFQPRRSGGSLPSSRSGTSWSADICGCARTRGSNRPIRASCGACSMRQWQAPRRMQSRRATARRCSPRPSSPRCARSRRRRGLFGPIPAGRSLAGCGR